MPLYELGSPTDPMLGKAVEGYRITGLIGKGGMGVVYEAVHAEIGQRAAVKVLFPEFSTDIDAVSRFVAEARAASKVQHGGLVKIFYSGRLEDGTAYIMMEYLDGESLELRLGRLSKESKRLELSAVTRLGQQIASALTAVHGEGIVHRDLKPANLILVADSEIDGGERIKVVDFGIAKFDQSTTEISKTTVGRFLGTALYASPEQCQMAGEVGSKADVYSLGVMLYEMLAGTTPFTAEQPGLVIGMHLFMQPRLLRDIVPDVPASLHRLIHQMLAKDPQQRPSMAEIQSRLATVKQDAPTLLRRLRRNFSLAIAAAVVVVLAGVGTLWRTAQHRPTTRVSPVPITAREEVPPRLPVPRPAAGLPAPATRPPPESQSAPILPKVHPVEVPSQPLVLGKPRRGKSYRPEPLLSVAVPREAKPPGDVTPPAAQRPPAVAPDPGIRPPATETIPAKIEPRNNQPKPATIDDGILR